MDTAILVVYKSESADNDEVEFILVSNREHCAEEFKKYVGRALLSVYRIGDKFKPDEG